MPCLGAHRHGCRSEVLHLFEMEVEFLGDHSQFRHILGSASGMRADEVGDELLAQSLGTVDAVEDGLEALKLLE